MPKNTVNPQWVVYEVNPSYQIKLLDGTQQTGREDEIHSIMLR
jgi:hypothetical protein